MQQSSSRPGRPAPGRTGPHGDSGQMMAALIIALSITVLAFLVVILLPVGAATNEATRSQTAADAAALAGAEAVRTQWVDVNTRPALMVYGVDPPGVTAGEGRGAAQDYARRNDARVLDYRVVPGRGQVHVEVENTYSAYPGTGEARSGAVAEMDVDFDDCSWSPRPPGLPTVEEGSPEPTFDATLRCGGWEAEYELLNSSVALFRVVGYAPGLERDDLYDRLEPGLTD